MTRVRAGERRALAKAITLIESTRRDDQTRRQAVLEALLPHAAASIRIGISGAPGVGKSTFVESFGLHLIARGHRVAVLAVDPSSSVTGGSILADKTRMEELSRSPGAFIRPSPAGTSLGGVAARTREALAVCEAAGFDVIIVETVGVGQSETAVARMTDLMVLLQLPNGGDELQHEEGHRRARRHHRRQQERPRPAARRTGGAHAEEHACDSAALVAELAATGARVVGWVHVRVAPFTVPRSRISTSWSKTRLICSSLDQT